jgi:hypothetical protein
MKGCNGAVLVEVSHKNSAHFQWRSGIEQALENDSLRL